VGALLAVALFFEFRSNRYSPSLYWLAVVLLSIVGTLITDNLTDNLGVALTSTTVVFSVLLMITFAVWYAKEKTLSVNDIETPTREAFYWLAILFTFALGTAGGDLVAESLKLGYLVSALIFSGLIAAAAIAHLRFGLNAVFSFWFAYILTRPLGASVGDYLSQPMAHGGLGLGAVWTSALFLTTIVIVVAYLAVTRKDARDRDESVS
jgi:uncharacterized membrane-anchored protein